MKSLKNKIIPFVVLVLSIGFIIYFTRDHLSELRQISSIRWYDIVFMSAVTLLLIAGNGIKNKFLVRPFGVRLSRQEWFGLSVVNTFWNYLPFQGGLIAKGVYLKKQHKFPYTDYLSIASASYIITFIILGLMGCIGIIILYVSDGLFSISILSGYALLVFLSLGALLYIKRQQSVRWFPQFSKRVYDGIRIIFNQRSLVYKLVIADVFIVILYALRLYIASNALGYDIPVLFYFLVSPVALLAIFTSITPGGLVIREMFIGFFAAMLSVDVANSVVVTVLDRGISLLWIFLLGIIFNVVLSRIIVKSRTNTHDEG